MKAGFRKVIKTLKKRCPECQEYLELIEYCNNRAGVIYSEQKIECSICGYSDDHRNYQSHKKKDLMYEL